MAQKHLHELLKEDQEPFYIANRRFQLKRLNFSSHKISSLQIKKIQKPTNQTPTTSKFCKNTCFFSFHDSPDVRKSPLYLPSPATKKCPENGKFVLHVPARTAALLLEAAMRIQKQQSSSKPKSQIKKVKFGLFGSILKRLKDRNSNKMGESKNGENSFSCSCSSSRVNSEINEEKSMDLETYSNNGDFSSCPLSPFRFSLQRCPSAGDVMPVFTSPAASPIHHKKEDKENYETIGSASNDQLEEEDEKEQSSPVSVLDPPFEEDQEDDGREDRDEDEDEDSDLDCSYALVQRAQQQLLYKLRRFEKLAELDPIELEKLLLEEDDDRGEEEEYQVCELISEEKPEVKSLNYGEAVFGRECKRLDSSQELTSNTTPIDMMVKSDLESESDEWNEFQMQREETAIEFAFSIFGLLVEELREDLIQDAANF